MATAKSQDLVRSWIGTPEVTGSRDQPGEEPRTQGRRSRPWQVRRVEQLAIFKVSRSRVWWCPVCDRIVYGMTEWTDPRRGHCDKSVTHEIP